MDFPGKLSQVRKDYLCGKPIKLIDWSILDNITWDEQSELLANTTNNAITQTRGDISHAYRSAFLSHIVQELERRGSTEIHDDLYQCLVDHLNGSSSRVSGYSWKHFDLAAAGVSDIVSIRQTESIISDGTTGLHSWQAAGALAEWSIHNRGRLHGKNVLELGSGTGLTGIVVAKTCAPARLLLTDGNEKVLALLRENVATNYESSEEDDDKRTAKLVSVCALDWNEVGGNTLDNMRPDVVLAADVVYDDSLFGPLCGAIDAVLARGASTGCVMYLACTVRNPDTLNAFLRQLDAYKFERTEERLVPPTMLYWDDTTPIRIFCITRQQ